MQDGAVVQRPLATSPAVRAAKGRSVPGVARCPPHRSRERRPAKSAEGPTPLKGEKTARLLRGEVRAITRGVPLRLGARVRTFSSTWRPQRERAHQQLKSSSVPFAAATNALCRL